MEISREEYLALTRRIEELEKERSMSKLLTYKCWAYAVNELPIEHIRVVETREPDIQLRYDAVARDTWGLFTKLAKRLHTPQWEYKAERHQWSGLYWRSSGPTSPPKRYDDLSEAQKQLSLEMLNELVPIYNKYFKMAHPGTWVTDLCGERCFLEVRE